MIIIINKKPMLKVNKIVRLRMFKKICNNKVIYFQIKRKKEDKKLLIDSW